VDLLTHADGLIGSLARLVEEDAAAPTDCQFPQPHLECLLVRLRPPLSSHASILLRRTSCEVAGVFTLTVSRVAGPGAFVVNPTTSELGDRERRGFVQRTGRHLDRVPDAFAVGEGDPNNQLPS
jgi:hypothetical protein